jgi:hypothetical protein
LGQHDAANDNDDCGNAEQQNGFSQFGAVCGRGVGVMLCAGFMGAEEDE